MNKIYGYLVLAAAFFSLSSCNTFIGMGKDIQRLGEGIQNTGYGTGWSGNKPSPYQQNQPEQVKKPAQP